MHTYLALRYERHANLLWRIKEWFRQLNTAHNNLARVMTYNQVEKHKAFYGWKQQNEGTAFWKLLQLDWTLTQPRTVTFGKGGSTTISHPLYCYFITLQLNYARSLVFFIFAIWLLLMLCCYACIHFSITWILIREIFRLRHWKTGRCF